MSDVVVAGLTLNNVLAIAKTLLYQAVDDELIVRDSLKEWLEVEGGFRVSMAESGPEALERIKADACQLMLLDIKMPGGIDGIEALREMKKIQPLAEVILLTGHASVETSIEGMKLGAFDYLLKPIKLEDLMVKLGEAFEKKDVHEQKIRKAQIKELMRFPGRVFQQEKE